ncbi:MAG TPA: divalent-cation tolerance protein CutA [Bauldia sp.]|nr:divalent-cation tolerance protein CutA [Bauldia sp.]
MLEVHVNFGNAEEASRVARHAVEKRLAACANIHAPIRSFYWWEQEVRAGEEVPVVFKTSEGKVHDLMDFIVRSHSYDTPGIVVHRPMTANAKYLAWIDRETHQMSKR